MKNTLKLIYVICILIFFSMDLVAKVSENECYLPMISCNNDSLECKKQQGVYGDFQKMITSSINPLEYTSYVNMKSDYDKETTHTNREVFFKQETLEIDGKDVLYGLSFYDDGLQVSLECKEQNCTKKAYNSDGNLQYEANCVSGVNNGPQRLYNWQGMLFLQIDYNNGKPNGTIQSYNNKKIYKAEIKNGKLNGKIHINGVFFCCDGGESRTFVAEVNNGNIIFSQLMHCIDECFNSRFKLTHFNANGTFDGVIESDYYFAQIKDSKVSKFKIAYEIEIDEMEYEHVKTWLTGGFNNKGERNGEWIYTSVVWDESIGKTIKKLKRHEIYINGVKTKILK
ncbi:hypothetical protein DCO58_07270 [Helicobacter saguini]|uniref:Toxin-antitoxin system YwqK family antitoxin n=1 Tax=Helicobacter saguini TaxID=1548018 RepID=A0A347VN82_9HELI|nr:hypothetical protein [Helicobacter saguini]MWV61867.1 hypothetical protein [Helicobacter saguini]MWV67458.1 hypothetical protein [Helicobacter saguini]MWV69810.1 hypothetical protein [Helicobacter saguini]MWV72972.1 hypothetical protein [Helicobacter saguini]TLD95647.1 hypothetical protein LS64_001990 [Helicobacter saguini]